jgi:DNA-directed RNA polymerase subunit RPC12/RpoP
MKELREKISKLSALISEDSNTDNRDFKVNVLDILSDICDEVEALQVNQENLTENIEFLNNDISDIQEDLFEDVSVDDLDCGDEKYVEITCNKCGKGIFFEQSALDNNTEIPCPYCGADIYTSTKN